MQTNSAVHHSLGFGYINASGRSRPPAAGWPACPDEEPEILELCAAHYRAMLNLPQLTRSDCQLLKLLLEECETTLAKRTAIQTVQAACRPGETWRATAEAKDYLQVRQQHVTAIRLYLAGIRRALEGGNAEAALQGLREVDALISGETVSRRAR